MIFIRNPGPGDRIFGAVLNAALPLTLGAILTATKFPKLATAAFIWGGASAIVGVVYPIGFAPGPSPLANRGWMNGYPAASDVQLLNEVNESLRASGGFTYSVEAL